MHHPCVAYRRPCNCATNHLFFRIRLSHTPYELPNPTPNPRIAPSMPIIVQKFGGTSVADSKKILAAARKAIRAQKEGNQVVMVVSAMGKNTDVLWTWPSRSPTSRRHAKWTCCSRPASR